jgi:hypothetical protein
MIRAQALGKCITSELSFVLLTSVCSRSEWPEVVLVALIKGEAGIVDVVALEEAEHGSNSGRLGPTKSFLAGLPSGMAKVNQSVNGDVTFIEVLVLSC